MKILIISVVLGLCLTGCMSDGKNVNRDPDQQLAQPVITTNPNPTADPSRNGSNLTGAADPNGGIAAPNGISGNVGGR